MEQPRVLLVDLRQYALPPSLQYLLEENCRLRTVLWTEDIEVEVKEHTPCGIFFEFDFPDLPRLALLQKIRWMVPKIPAVMCTEEHSEALAVWALRSRVWDYFVKPVDPGQIDQTIDSLERMARGKPEGDGRVPILPAISMPLEARFRPDSRPPVGMARVADFIDRHLSRPISQKEAARLCDMNPSQFSRSFKKAFGMTFQAYLMERRLEKARRLLHNRSASVTDVCWAIGLRDISYFSRLFKRQFGTSPSEFQRAWRAECSGQVNP
ncbi:helix-turn-helix domain-containing protein [Thiohalomonas denitrificans]|uniref:AraC-type DNA-binding protein n=1 Tax=Thiohalomonas denitrificans TaxID=415747 RepID=A0A1G5QFU8_9GAMM|nr:AraC family transcriptional regulator [Thiohalomonas denitrificans]SCZ60231.1 AraC-type DNA-binding protein [Thiohalomonas denitrificans]